MFVAIVANRDGHEFIPQAIENGAKAVLVSKEQQNINIPQIVCDNTIKGLRTLAKTYRKTLNMPIISLTGSCGKTSVKEMIVTLLKDYKTHATFANFNNYLGVPLTVLQTPQDVEFAVIEAGTSVKGEIKAAADIICPDVALITNVGASHLESLETVDGVMIEKGTLLQAVANGGCCVINTDDQRIFDYAKSLNCRVISCSMNDSNADIFVRSYTLGEDNYNIIIQIFDKQYEYTIPNMGKHNVGNSMLAIACVAATGINPNDFLKNSVFFDGFEGRFSSKKINKNLTIVDDTYNASVSAVKAAIDDLIDFEGKKILVISSMKELGDEADLHHRYIGDEIAKSNIDHVLLFGDVSHLSYIVGVNKSNDVKYFTTKHDLNDRLSELLLNYTNEATKIIIKGARSYKMEEIVGFVVQRFSNK
jgi:UDP-N-acetylmuramoyl-tripeptide--D-alanyl-D-alanine ligase